MSQKVERSTVKYCLLDGTWPLQSQTQSSTSYLHNIKPVNFSMDGIEES